MEHHINNSKTFEKTGFSQLKLVDKQMIPDGNFTHAKSSNPEES